METTTKEQLVQSIREWVKLDNEMRALKLEMTSRKKIKDSISANLVTVMKEN